MEGEGIRGVKARENQPVTANTRAARTLPQTSAYERRRVKSTALIKASDDLGKRLEDRIDRTGTEMREHDVLEIGQLIV